MKRNNDWLARAAISAEHRCTPAADGEPQRTPKHWNRQVVDRRRERSPNESLRTGLFIVKRGVS